MSEPREWVGQVVEGEFTLREYLGGSEHSAVFLTEFGQRQPVRAAIKFVQADTAAQERQLSRWKRAAEICHPRLLRIFRTGHCQIENVELLYVVMEFAGENLAQVLPERALTPNETGDAIEPVLEALAYLHGQGLVHGHLKPSNILACNDQLKLSTDGICAVGDVAVPRGASSQYEPPEAPTAPVDAARDIWALGMTLVEALTQRLPAWDAASQSVTQRAEPAVPETLPAPFLETARNCLRRDPKLRWTIAEVGARLNPTVARPASVARACNNASATSPEITAALAAEPAPAAIASEGMSRARQSEAVRAVSPVSVALSSAPALPIAKQALQKQAVAKPQLRIQNIRPKSSASGNSMYMYSRSFAHSRYFVPTVGVALAVILIVPIFARHRPSRPTVEGESVVTAKAGSGAPGYSKLQRLGQSEAEKKQGHAKPESAGSVNPASRNSRAPSQSSPQIGLEPANDKKGVDNRTNNGGVPPPSMARSSAARAHLDPPPAASSSNGEVLNQVLPQISSKAQATIHGTVRVSVKVSVDGSGNVTLAELASPSPSKYFGEQALQAARKWDFAPPKSAGHNVESAWLLRFEFTQSATRVVPKETTP